MKIKYEIVKAWETKSGLKAIVILYEPTPQIKYHCGYVVIPKNSIFYNKNYNDEIKGFDTSPASFSAPSSIGSLFEVHRGITMSGYLSDDISKEINKKLYPGEYKKRWLFGYDCCNYGDNPMQGLNDCGTWKDVDYCIAECESLAEQIIGVDEKYLGLTSELEEAVMALTIKHSD